MPLFGCQLILQDECHREGVVRDMIRDSGREMIVLNTCQRLECFGFEGPRHEQLEISKRWEDAEAFERLTRIAAGLESRILGELEVLGQVRDAYKRFHTRNDNTRLDRMFQEVLALARRARKESGIDNNLTSLGALAARELLDHVPAGAPLLVVGSGSMAGSVARYLGKRGKSPVRITSRCPENAMSLAVEIGGFGGGLDEMAHLFRDVAGIITATAAPHAVVFPQHVEIAARPLHVIDLGTPPDCHEGISALPGVTYTGLEQVERKAQVNTEDRRRRAKVAARIVRDGANAWAKKN